VLRASFFMSAYRGVEPQFTDDAPIFRSNRRRVVQMVVRLLGLRLQRPLKPVMPGEGPIGVKISRNVAMVVPLPVRAAGFTHRDGASTKYNSPTSWERSAHRVRWVRGMAASPHPARYACRPLPARRGEVYDFVSIADNALLRRMHQRDG
jgi:hypothetical protein